MCLGIMQVSSSSHVYCTTKYALYSLSKIPMSQAKGANHTCFVVPVVDVHMLNYASELYNKIRHLSQLVSQVEYPAEA